MLERTAITLPDGTILYKTVSIGAAEASANDADFSKIIVRSDEALYEAKTSGRNRICFSPTPGAAQISKDEASAPSRDASPLKAIDF
jgi:predicted signal transduction protein with EAL and GGDEF domain